MHFRTSLVGVLAALTALVVNGAVVQSKTEDIETTVPVYNTSEAIDLDLHGERRPSRTISTANEIIKSEPLDLVQPTGEPRSIAARQRDGNEGGTPWSGGSQGDWNDPYGPVSRGWFSFVFTLTNPGTAHAVVFRQSGTGSKATLWHLRCRSWCKGAKGSWNKLRGWTPYVLRAHSSRDWCDKSGGDDNIWLDYANQHYNVERDVRCERTVNLPDPDPDGNDPFPPVTSANPNPHGVAATQTATGDRPKHTAHNLVEKRWPWDCASENDGDWDEQNQAVEVPSNKAPLMKQIHTHRCFVAICPGNNKYGAPVPGKMLSCVKGLNNTMIDF